MIYIYNGPFLISNRLWRQSYKSFNCPFSKGMHKNIRKGIEINFRNSISFKCYIFFEMYMCLIAVSSVIRNLRLLKNSLVELKLGILIELNFINWSSYYYDKLKKRAVLFPFVRKLLIFLYLYHTDAMIALNIQERKGNLIVSIINLISSLI